LGALEPCPFGQGSSMTLQKHAPLHLCYHTAFGRSRSKRAGISRFPNRFGNDEASPLGTGDMDDPIETRPFLTCAALLNLVILLVERYERTCGYVSVKLGSSTFAFQGHTR